MTERSDIHVWQTSKDCQETNAHITFHLLMKRSSTYFWDTEEIVRRQYLLVLLETVLCFRTLLALGYHISYDPQHTSNTRLKTLKLPNRYDFTTFSESAMICKAIQYNNWNCKLKMQKICISNTFSYLQENGYKPTPLDLSQIRLNKHMTELVELLAENTHNVWAKR